MFVFSYQAKIQVVVEVSGPSPNPKTRRRENVAAEVISGPLVWEGITLAEMNT